MNPAQIVGAKHTPVSLLQFFEHVEGFSQFFVWRGHGELPSQIGHYKFILVLRNKYIMLHSYKSILLNENKSIVLHKHKSIMPCKSKSLMLSQYKCIMPVRE